MTSWVVGSGRNSADEHGVTHAEPDERRFWESRDSFGYVDWRAAERARFPNLKPSITAISLRLPAGLLERITAAADKRDMPYRSPIEAWLTEKLDKA